MNNPLKRITCTFVRGYFLTGRHVTSRHIKNNRCLHNVSIVKRFQQISCGHTPFHRLIHTSHVKKSPQLIVAMILRPFVAAVSGRLIRRWWQKRSPEEKKKIWRHREKVYWGILMYIFTAFGYYIWHIEQTPLTKRKRFMAMGKNDLDFLSESTIQAIIQQYGNQSLKPHDPRVQRVMRVAQRIVEANNDLPHIKGQNLTVTVIDSPGVMNAMVTVSGKIIIFADMLSMCQTDDELAIVISHEMSHAVLEHVAEKFSSLLVTGFVFFPIVAGIWLTFPSDIIAALTTYASSKMMDLLVELPFSRKLEIEADEVGLMLAARACFDVRQSVIFWNKMKEQEARTLGVDKMPKCFEYMSTHPQHETRAENLTRIMSHALDVREKCSCPKLAPLPIVLNLRPVIPEYSRPIHIRRI